MADVTLDQPSQLGQYLKTMRMGQSLSLRDVEEATGKEVSNAYLSQLETGKVRKPSPHVLYALSTALAIPYEALMERTGYIAPKSDDGQVPKRVKSSRFSIDNLTAEEEVALREHLSYLRWRKKHDR